MNIQAIDGKWYVNPSWIADNYAVYVTIYDEIILNYKGHVLWTTARRALHKFGIKAKLDGAPSNDHFVFGNRFVPSSLFSLRLIRPIPVPQSHKGFFDEAPNPLFNGRTQSWKRSGKRWIPTGPTYL